MNKDLPKLVLNNKKKLNLKKDKIIRIIETKNNLNYFNLNIYKF